MSDEPIYPTLRELLKYAKPGGLFVDVGAHHGLFSAAFSKKLMRVIAVEPAKDNFYQFHLNTMGTGIPCLPVALSDTDGEALLYDGGPSTVHSLIPEMARAMFPDQQAEQTPQPYLVKTQKWDTFCRDCRIEEVEILKLDAKWNNLPVLGSLCDAGPVPHVICTEIRRDDREEITALLESHGYVLLETVGLDRERDIHDAIFVREIE